MDFILGIIGGPAIAAIIVAIFVGQSSMILSLLHIVCIGLIVITVGFCLFGIIGCWMSDRLIITKIIDTPVILALSYTQILLIQTYSKHLCIAYNSDKIEYLCSLFGGMIVIVALLLADSAILYMADDKDNSLPNSFFSALGYLFIYGMIMMK